MKVTLTKDYKGTAEVVRSATIAGLAHKGMYQRPLSAVERAVITDVVDMIQEGYTVDEIREACSSSGVANLALNWLRDKGLINPREYDSF